MTSDGSSKSRAENQRGICARLLRSALCLGTLGTFVYLSVTFWETLSHNFMIGLNWIQSLGLLYGSIALCATNIVGALLVLPCLPFTLASGTCAGPPVTPPLRFQILLVICLRVLVRHALRHDYCVHRVHRGSRGWLPYIQVRYHTSLC